jgi:RNA polymerase sigma factor (sigma-70 family)
VTETGRSKNEDPQDAEQLAALRHARACGDIEGEKRAIAALIAGWLGKAERWLLFKGVDPEDREEILSLWWGRLVKTLKENQEFPHAFSTIAMTRIAWAHAEYFRKPYHRQERSSEDPVADQDGQQRQMDDAVVDHLVITKALGSLGARDREVIEVTFLSDLSAAEAGQRLGLKEGALRTAKSRALERLRSEFGQMGVTNFD